MTKRTIEIDLDIIAEEVSEVIAHKMGLEEKDEELSKKTNLVLLKSLQEEVDLAYKDGYEKGKEYTFYKGYLEGLGDKEKEHETVASIIADFYKSGVIE